MIPPDQVAVGEGAGLIVVEHDLAAAGDLRRRCTPMTSVHAAAPRPGEGLPGRRQRR